MKPLKWLAFGCSHEPLTDKDARAWSIDRIRSLQPDVIVDLGDAFGMWPGCCGGWGIGQRMMMVEFQPASGHPVDYI